MEHIVREIEGTWEEIQRYSVELIGCRVRLSIISEESEQSPSGSASRTAFAAAMSRAEEELDGAPLTPAENTQMYLEEARSGGMWGGGNEQ